MSFSSKDLIMAGIPQDILIDTLYEATVRREDVLTALPRRTMIGTLHNKYTAIRTLGDLFDDSTSTKAFNEFRTGILSNASDVCAVNEAMTEITTIPSVPFSTLEEGLRAFLPEYLDAKVNRAKLINYHVNSTQLTSAIFQKLFDEHSIDNSRKRVASDLHITSQNIDDKINTIHDDLYGLFFNDKITDNIMPSPLLVKMVRNVYDSFTVPGSTSELKRISGIVSPVMLELLALIFGVIIQESGVVVPMGRAAGTLGAALGSKINRNKLALKKILKDEGIPISFADFRILMKENFDDEELRLALEQYARCGKEYEVFTDSSGIERIAVRWEYLKDLTTEIIRILYDNGAFGVKNAMGPDEIRNEWERRARIIGKKSEFHSHYNKHWRLSASRKGFVMLRWSKSDEGFLDGQTYVSRLLYDNPGWSAEDVIKQASIDGYSRIYTAASIRTYYTNMVKDTRVEQALSATVKMLDYAPGNTLPFKEISTEVRKTIDVEDANLRKWVIRNDRTFDYFTIPGKKFASVKLLSKKTPLITPYSSVASTSTSPAATVAPATITPAASTSTPVIDFGVALNAILAMVPESKVNVFLISSANKIFDIMKEGQPTFAENNVFNSWLRNIADFAAMTSWDKDSVRLNVLRTMETYIGNFYQMKTGQDLRTDIMYDSSFYTKSSTFGLGTKVSYLRYLSILPPKGPLYKSGSLEESICKAARTVVDARDENAGHPDTLISMTQMGKEVHDALLLILYLAAKL